MNIIIKIGLKNEHGYPQSVDYFIPAGKYASLFTKSYGDKPNTIQIIFPDDDPQKVCCEQYEYRDDDGRLIAQGDGKTFKVWDGGKYEELTIKEYPNLMMSINNRYPNRLFRSNGDGWRIRLTLNFIIPLVRGVAGIWMFETNGNLSTIPQIRDVFDTMLQERGFCKGIIFDLSVQFATSQKPGSKSKYPVVSLIPNESSENLHKIKDAYKPLTIESK